MKKCFLCHNGFMKVKNLHDDHEYCLKCFSKLQAGYIPSECEKCNELKNIGKQGFFRNLIGSSNKCKFCSKTSKETKLCYICDEHFICSPCLYKKHSSYTGNMKDEKCLICLEIYANSCRECFIILENSEKVTKTNCSLHIFCEKCRRSSIDPKKCLACSKPDEFSQTYPSYAMQIVTNPPRNQFSNFTIQSIPQNPEFNYPFNQEHQNFFPQIQSIPQNNSITYSNCNSCSSSDSINLECSHSFCLQCIFNYFKKDFQEFLMMIQNHKFNEIESKNFCFKCPAEYNCFSKFIIPFQFEIFKIFMSQTGQFEGVNWRFIKECSAFFDGVRYRFFICLKCGAVAGCPLMMNYCYNCNFRMV